MKEVFPLVPATSGPLITFGIATLALGSMIFLPSRGPIIVFCTMALVLGGMILLLASFAFAPRYATLPQNPSHRGKGFLGNANLRHISVVHRSKAHNRIMKIYFPGSPNFP